MRVLVFQIVWLCVISKYLINAASSDEELVVAEMCCAEGEAFAVTSSSAQQCSTARPPDGVDPELTATCLTELRRCCEQHVKSKEECTAGISQADSHHCAVPKTDIGKTCCEECKIGKLTGETQGKEACGGPPEEDDIPISALRKNAYYQCCLEAADRPETTTERRVETTRRQITTQKPTTTTQKKIVVKCKADSCEHICNDYGGKITCQCREGYRLHADKKSCKDINECAEAVDDLCTAEGTVCHNTPGSFKCVPIKKRDVSLTCPAGFQRNVQNQVCDDINECQLQRPPCPKYLCENTIGGYKCAGRPGKPFEEEPSRATTEETFPITPVKNDICPPGFRAGPNDDCIDIDECNEGLDDCQRLSQHCINTHGSFFCQDHVSKRCAPGFKVNAATGICEDIDECEESSELCKRSEVCVNMPGAYTCKSKISTLPKLATKTCQEGTRLRPGGTICEDIDECREGTHLCDQFQNCINTFAGHECRCKNGFELDSSGSCVDLDECQLKLDNCKQGTYCLNVLGSFTCTRRPPTSSTTTSTAGYEYEYYYSDEETSPETKPAPVRTTTSTTTTRAIPTTTTVSTVSTPQPTRPPYKPHLRSTTTRRPYRPPPPTTPLPSTTQKTTTTEVATTSKRPEVPVTPRRPPSRRPVTPVEVTVPTPVNPDIIERDKDPEGSYAVDTGDIPKDKWTNVIGRDRTDKPEEAPFDPNLLHCLNGFERNAQGDCADVNECEQNRHICSTFEICENRSGGYVCNCRAGSRRDPSGQCITVITTSTSTTTTTTSTTARPITARTTSTTERAIATPRTTDWSPYRPRQFPPVMVCELGYTFDTERNQCVDIDECARHLAKCSKSEECINLDGGYKCFCGTKCRSESNRPTHVAPPRQPSNPGNNVITVGAQYGQRGMRYVRPSYTRLPDSGAIVNSCPWGYKLTQDKMCIDIDECAKNVSECGPQQRCENFYGGYSCQCPAGHKLVGQDSCEDIDECVYSQPCTYNAQCINTIGSYRCACAQGFRNAPANEKVCVDIDECSETPNVCEQGCANSWGSYRCYCDRGYRIHTDNRTCVDVDECAEWTAVRHRGRLCGGDCVNEPGSYRCSCPKGYRLSDDTRSCIDIDECETGEATCAVPQEGEVCQNTRGGYHCHKIECPHGYRLESKHRCSRIQRSCPVGDWTCLHQPSSYSYNFITFVANIYLPEGSVDLFTMHGPAWRDSVVNFEMRMINSQASNGVRPADLSCFDMRPTNNVCVISLLCSLGGPQVAEMELTMSLYQRGHYAGSAVARLVVIVSQYDF